MRAIGVELELLAPAMQRAQAFNLGRTFDAMLKHEADQVFHLDRTAMLQRRRTFGRLTGQRVELHRCRLFLQQSSRAWLNTTKKRSRALLFLLFIF
ncbi:hypothetical protein D3C81_1808330 [compost metagenome]